jgi:hypothetical protein
MLIFDQQKPYFKNNIVLFHFYPELTANSAAATRCLLMRSDLNMVF